LVKRLLLKGRRGITLIELMIALIISGIVMLASTTLLKQPQALIETAMEKTADASLEDLRMRQLTERFSRSYPMRRGFVACNTGTGTESVNLRTLLSGTDPFPAGTFSGAFVLPEAFSLAYSTFGSMAGIAEDTGEITVSQPGKFYVGGIVLLSAINDPTLGGIFKVTAITPASTTEPQTTLTIAKAATADIPTDFDCVLQNSLSLADIMADNGNKVFGSIASTFRLDAMQFVRYERRASRKKAGDQDLYEKLWPTASADGSGPVAEGPVTTGITQMRVENASWARTGSLLADGNPRFASDGDFRMGLVLDRREVMMGNRALATQKVNRRIANYSTHSTNQVNTGVILIPPPVSLSFPTCTVVITPLNDFLALRDGTNASVYAALHRLRYVVGGSPTMAGLIVEMESGLGPVNCWREDRIQAGSPPFLLLSEAAAESVTLSSLTPLDTAICDLQDITSITAVLRYMVSETNSMAQMTCSVAGTPPSGVTFTYDGTASYCLNDGTISFGTLNKMVSGTAAGRGPTLFTDGTSCTWSGTTDQSCTPNPSKGTLTQVQLRPSGITGITDHSHACTATIPPAPTP